MIARFTTVYENVIEESDKDFLQQALEDGDSQVFEEFFRIGWKAPKDEKLEFFE